VQILCEISANCVLRSAAYELYSKKSMLYVLPITFLTHALFVYGINA